jgi:hypothetical protein
VSIQQFDQSIDLSKPLVDCQPDNPDPHSVVIEATRQKPDFIDHLLSKPFGCVYHRAMAKSANRASVGQPDG